VPAFIRSFEGMYCYGLDHEGFQMVVCEVYLMLSFLLVFVSSYVQDRSLGFRVDTMKTKDYSSCSSCCEGSLCSDCASIETSSIRDDLQDITVDEQPCVPHPLYEAVAGYPPVGGDDNSILSRSHAIPRNVRHVEQDLMGGQPSHGGRVTRAEEDHPPVGTTVKVRTKCCAMTKLGRDCIDAALPDSVYCGNHQLAAQPVSINTVNSRIVPCCGKTKKGEQCKDTAKAGSLYCSKHSENAIVPPNGRKKICQCRCLTESGTQCPNTAKTGYLYCGTHSLPPTVPGGSREAIFRCRGLTHRGVRCLDTAKDGSAYCRKHSNKPKAPPTSSMLAKCSGRKKNDERCKDTTRAGTLYCRKDIAPVSTQGSKTDNVQIPVKVKGPERQQCNAKTEPFVDRSHPDLQQEDRCSDTVNKQIGGEEVQKEDDVYEQGKLEDVFREVLILNLPKVPESKAEKLTKVVVKLITRIGTLVVNPETNCEGVLMSFDQELGTTCGACLVEYETAEQAKNAVEVLQGYRFDKNHSLSVILYPRDAYLKDFPVGDFQKPAPTPFQEKPNSTSWLEDPNQRDSTVNPLGKLHIVNISELERLLKGWVVAHREGSRLPISGNLIFRGPRGKIQLMSFFELLFLLISPVLRSLRKWQEDCGLCYCRSPLCAWFKVIRQGYLEVSGRA
jgi:hypothetical protein